MPKPKYKYKNVKHKLFSGEEVDIRIENKNLDYHPRLTILPKNDVIELFEKLFPGFVRNIREYKGELYSYIYSEPSGWSNDWFMSWWSMIDFKSFILKTRILIEKKGLSWFDQNFDRKLLFERFNAFFWEAEIIRFLYYDSFHTEDEHVLTFIEDCRGLPLYFNEKRQAEEISPFFKNFFKKNAGDILPLIAKKALSFLDNKTMSEWCECRRPNWPFSDVGDEEIEEHIRMFEWVQTNNNFPRLPDPLRTPEIDEFLVEKRIENRKQYYEFCFQEERERSLKELAKELAQRKSSSQKELDEKIHNLSKSMEQVTISKPKKVGQYYEILGIEKEYFRTDTSIDYYLKSRKENVQAAHVLESFSVLSHPELRKIYDSFVEKDLEGDFLTLIGNQFYSFYDFYINDGLWKDLEEKDYCLEKSLSEKVLEIAKKLEELERKSKGFFVDIEKRILTKDAITIFIECFFLEKDSTCESIGDKYIGENRFEEEIKKVSFYLLKLITLRESFSFVNLCDEPYVLLACGMFMDLRLFASADLSYSLETFSKNLFEVKNKDELDHLLLIFEKFELKARELAAACNKNMYKGEFDLLYLEKYSSLSFYSIRHLSDKQKEENNYRKVWRDVCDFLETYEKRFLESSSLPSSSGKVDTSKIVVQDESSSSPSSSEKVDTSKTVIQDEKGTFFEDRWGIISIILILVIVSSGSLGWWFYRKNKSKK